MITQKTISRDKLQIGMEVIVIPRSDRSRTQRVTGMISEILTKAQEHPHGILVRIDSGVVGRVQSIVSSKTTKPILEIGSKSKEFNIPVAISDADIGNLLIQEDQFVEYKSSALWSVNLSKDELSASKSFEIKKYGRNASKFIIAKTLAGFLNTEGGFLLVGIRENKSLLKDEVIGIDAEFKKINDPCLDGYRRMIVDSIVKPFFPKSIFNHFSSYININFHVVEGKTLCILKAEKSDHKIFLKHGGVESFFIRVDATTREISGEQIVDYCMRRFQA